MLWGEVSWRQTLTNQDLKICLHYSARTTSPSLDCHQNYVMLLERHSCDGKGDLLIKRAPMNGWLDGISAQTYRTLVSGLCLGNSWYELWYYFGDWDISCGLSVKWVIMIKHQTVILMLVVGTVVTCRIRMWFRHWWGGTLFAFRSWVILTWSLQERGFVCVLFSHVVLCSSVMHSSASLKACNHKYNSFHAFIVRDLVMIPC